MASATTPQEKIDEAISAELASKITAKDVTQWEAANDGSEFVDVYFAGAFSMPMKEFQAMHERITKEHK